MINVTLTVMYDNKLNNNQSNYQIDKTKNMYKFNFKNHLTLAWCINGAIWEKAVSKYYTSL